MAPIAWKVTADPKGVSAGTIALNLALLFLIGEWYCPSGSQTRTCSGERQWKERWVNKKEEHGTPSKEVRQLPLPTEEVSYPHILQPHSGVSRAGASPGDADKEKEVFRLCSGPDKDRREDHYHQPNTRA